MDWRRRLPEGMKDKLFREAAGTYELEKNINQLLEKRGYQRIETPVLEYDEVFQKGAAEAVHYRFFEGEQLVTLRPDMTLPVGRVVATTGVQLPLKLSYSGKVFRKYQEGMGLPNERLQAGVELLGFPSLKAELEAIQMALQVTQQLQINDWHLELGHAKIYETLIQELELDQRQEVIFREELLNKSFSGFAAFAENQPLAWQPFLRALPELFGPAELILTKALALVPPTSQLKEAFQELQTLVALLVSQKDLTLTVDLGLVPAMRYYTGILFNGYADQVPETIFQGGRYDHLLEEFGGAPVAAVGLALNLDSLVEWQYRTGNFYQLPQKKILIHSELAFWQQAEALQQATPNSQLSLFEDIEAAKAYAAAWHYEEVWQVAAVLTKWQVAK